jgi:hypothetical protein
MDAAVERTGNCRRTDRALDPTWAAGPSTREWVEKWTPTHASKAACVNQLPTSLSSKRTVAFGSARRARGAAPFGASLQSWQGQFQGQSRGQSAGA